MNARTNMITFLSFTTKVQPLLMGTALWLIIAGAATWISYVTLPVLFLVYKRDWALLQELKATLTFEEAQALIEEIERRIKELEEKE